MYYDIRQRADRLKPFSIIIGGRGIGKTYSALSFLLETGARFLYVRNTDLQMQECASQFGNPFKRINLDTGRDVRLEREQKHYVINDYTEDPDAPRLIGYGAALSTFENLRSADLSDVDYILFEEFISKKKLAFKQYEAFFSMYETIARNREIQGRPPLISILLSNSQTLNNEILAGFDLIDKIVKMKTTGQKSMTDGQIYIELPEAEISARKKETALYQAAGSGDMVKEALENEFAHDSFARIVKRPIMEYTPICTVEGPRGYVTFYRHKDRMEIYASDVPSWSAPIYHKDDLAKFMRDYGIRMFTPAYVAGRLYFCSFAQKSNVMELLRL